MRIIRLSLIHIYIDEVSFAREGVGGREVYVGTHCAAPYRHIVRLFFLSLERLGIDRFTGRGNFVEQSGFQMCIRDRCTSAPTGKIQRSWR